MEYLSTDTDFRLACADAEYKIMEQNLGTGVFLNTEQKRRIFLRELQDKGFKITKIKDK